VNLVSLDEVFSSGEKVSMVKLDLEGFELDALMGMEQMLRERRIDNIVFEELATIQLLRMNSSGKQVIRFLDSIMFPRRRVLP